MKTAYNNMIKYYLGDLNISLIKSVVNLILQRIGVDHYS